LIHGYRAATSYTDALIGRLLDTLDRQRLWDNTIVVLWGDHGWKLGEHGAWCKHSNAENDTNAPLIVAAPGSARAGRRTDQLVEFVDIYPSLCELAGLPVPAHCEGDSFVRLLGKPRTPWKDAAFSQYPRTVGRRNVMGYSMRTERYRYTRWVETGNRSNVVAVELYDHRADPGENRNIAGAPFVREIEADLGRRWEAGWQGVRQRHRGAAG
ncbi:MAG: sulfatase/phosphatase domain-containing protein, partial [Armatimonadaceae bacterium]